MKHLISAFFLSVFFIACQKTEKVLDGRTEEKTILNVSYGNDTTQRMDVYLPANRTTSETKALVLIHGGAWSGGDKAEFNGYIAELKRRLPDFAFFNINYRLAKFPATNIFPTQENDIKAALENIFSKAQDYGFNNEKLALIGASAGAHLALLQAYKNNSPAIDAVIDLFGPTDMVMLYNNVAKPLEKIGLQALLAGTPQTNPGLYQASSPINFITAKTSPTLILHGSADTVVPLSQSTTLKAKLESAGVPVRLVIYQNVGHGWQGESLVSSFSEIENFLKEYVR